MNLLLFLACGASMDAAPEAQRAKEAPAPMPAAPMEEAEDAMRDEGGVAGGAIGRGGAAPRGLAQTITASPAKKAAMKGKQEADGASAGESTQVRAWFPESFLWAPLIETDASGQAIVPITVPDTLTTWRVLALAQSADGGQAGTTTTFRSTMPAYVDLLLPSFLRAGDRLSLPVQVVNQSNDALSGRLSVRVQGGQGGGEGPVAVAGFGTTVEAIDLRADRSGTLEIAASLAGVDAVERTVPVQSVGLPVDTRIGGSLAGPRSLSVVAPITSHDGTIRVLAFPGALSVVNAELGAAADRLASDVWSAAYQYALTQSAAPLVGHSDLTADALREAEIRGLQRVRRFSTRQDIATAAALTRALSGSDPESVAGRLYERMATLLEDQQQPDGLWGMSSGSSIDQILVQTAQAVWALGDRGKAAKIRATGAFERYKDRLSDPYVAAWVAASGADALPAQVTETIRKAIQTAPDGSRYLKTDGSFAEGTALAILALPADAAELPDLAAWLLSHYDPAFGFGDGRTNLLTLQALNKVFGGELPAGIKVSLRIDGQAAGEAVLDPSQPHRPIALLANATPGPHTLELTADPPTPGLAFVLTHRAYLPWEQATPAGLDLGLSLGGPLRVGVATPLTITVAGPNNTVADVVVGLPAGVTVANSPAGVTATDGRLELSGVQLPNGQASVTVQVVPAFAGALQSGAATVTVQGTTFTRVPTTWMVE